MMCLAPITVCGDGCVGDGGQMPALRIPSGFSGGGMRCGLIGWCVWDGYAGDMLNYRRIKALGDTYFFTVLIAEWSNSLLVNRIGDSRDAFCAAHAAWPSMSDAIVILPEGDAGYPVRWTHIKAHFPNMFWGKIGVTHRRS